MKKFQKLLCMIFSLAMVLQIAACGAKETSNGEDGSLSETTAFADEAEKTTKAEKTTEEETTEAETETTEKEEETTRRERPHVESHVKVTDAALSRPNELSFAPYENIKVTEATKQGFSVIKFNKDLTGCLSRKSYDLDGDGENELLVISSVTNPEYDKKYGFLNQAYINMDIFENEDGEYVNSAHLSGVNVASKFGLDFYFGTMNITFNRFYVYILPNGGSPLICFDMNETWTDAGVRALFAAFKYDGESIELFAEGSEYGTGSTDFGKDYYDAGKKCGVNIKNTDGALPDITKTMILSFVNEPVTVYSENPTKTQDVIFEDPEYTHNKPLTIDYEITITDDK
ncbi:MAG: hypothetical protein K6F09_00355 [Clostridiales bacterium]|nr:hypothetical protein [Clostridiales bacterium]